MGRRIHAWLRATSAKPKKAPSPKKAKAIALTLSGWARPWPTSRTGPTRSSSVPRMPSL